MTARGENLLPTAESFGPTIQGEGPYAGRLAAFLRLGRCNLHCEPCDTPHTWDTRRYDLEATCPPTDVTELADRIATFACPITVITGGEPLIWQATPAWAKLLAHLPGALHVETNGTIAPNPATANKITHWSVSPKLSAMGAADPAKRRIRPHALEAFAGLAHTGRACLKIVCAHPGDVAEAARFADSYAFPPDTVWVMPRGATHTKATNTARRIAAATLAHGFNMSPRLHLMIGAR